MCNRFEIDTDGAALALALDAQLPLPFTFEPVVYPRQLTPGLWLNPHGQRELQPMQFALAPPGSKTPSDRKRAYNNTRLESVEKWPWKIPFRRFRCIVPITSFREPCYWGQSAGKEVDFKPSESTLLGVAAVYSIWKAAQGQGDVVTMSMLTRPAAEYVMQHGHHRMPFFVQNDGYDEWMKQGDHETDEMKRVLREHALEPELEFQVAREMADSWKKRQSAREAERDRQLSSIERCGPLGI